MRFACLVQALLFLLVSGCGEPEPSDTPVVSEDPSVVGSCSYTNKFNSESECKEYTGDTWTSDGAEEDCGTANLGGPGAFSPGTACEVSRTLGRCAVDTDPGYEFTIFLGGDDSSLCSGAELACTTFAGGTFGESGVCVEPQSDDEHTVFIWPYRSCDPPVEGEPPGEGPDGTVCAWNIISGCVEEGRDYRDYGSCDVVFTNRPYYPVDPYSESAPDDPRLLDDEYMEELAWVTEQAKSCACICCHTNDAPEGPAIWGVDTDPLWPDMMSDIAIGMFSGYIDSSALGAYPEEDNNGFDRTNSAMPTTDPVRMVEFWLGEFNRRGLSTDEMSQQPPIGSALLDQIDYELPDCTSGDGLSPKGNITWESEFDARYLYILEEGSENPGLPPNFDLPDGTVWRVDMPHDGEPFASGVRFGVLPKGAIQYYPHSASPPPELTAGKRYHLYVLYDVALPIARCVFEVSSDAPSKGCSAAGGRSVGAIAMGFVLLAVLGRRRRTG